MYGVISGKDIVIAPKSLIIDGKEVPNPTDEMYIKAGYKQAVFVDQPTAPIGYLYESVWTDGGSNLLQTWSLVHLPDDIDDAEAFDIIFGGAE